jgi:hypothetical protein
MKITGRNIKRRLYGLSTLPSNLKRARYFRGHGVHSPYVYALVRQVFMRSSFIGEERTLYNDLLERGVAERRAVQLQNVMEHCRYASYRIDCPLQQIEGHDMVIATVATAAMTLAEMADKACEAGVTLCILSPALDRERDMACRKIVEAHPSTSVDNRGYLLLFNNHLPKQKFRL